MKISSLSLSVVFTIVYILIFIPIFFVDIPFALAAIDGPYDGPSFSDITYEPLVNIPGLDRPTGREADIGNLVNALFGIAIAIAAMLAVIKLIIGGVKYMLSDIVTTKGEARNEITSALLGLLLILSTYLILWTINSNITQLQIADSSLNVEWYEEETEILEGKAGAVCESEGSCNCGEGMVATNVRKDPVDDRRWVADCESDGSTTDVDVSATELANINVKPGQGTAFVDYLQSNNTGILDDMNLSDEDKASWTAYRDSLVDQYGEDLSGISVTGNNEGGFTVTVPTQQSNTTGEGNVAEDTGNDTGSLYLSGNITKDALYEWATNDYGSEPIAEFTYKWSEVDADALEDSLNQECSTMGGGEISSPTLIEANGESTDYARIYCF